MIFHRIRYGTRLMILKENLCRCLPLWIWVQNSAISSCEMNAWNSFLKRKVMFAARFPSLFSELVATNISHQLMQLRSHRTWEIVLIVSTSIQLACDNSKCKPQNCNRIVVQSRRAFFDSIHIYQIECINVRIIVDQFPCHTHNTMLCIAWALF